MREVSTQQNEEKTIQEQLKVVNEKIKKIEKDFPKNKRKELLLENENKLRDFPIWYDQLINNKETFLLFSEGYKGEEFWYLSQNTAINFAQLCEFQFSIHNLAIKIDALQDGQPKKKQLMDERDELIVKQTDCQEKHKKFCDQLKDLYPSVIKSLKEEPQEIIKVYEETLPFLEQEKSVLENKIKEIQAIEKEKQLELERQKKEQEIEKKKQLELEKKQKEELEKQRKEQELERQKQLELERQKKEQEITKQKQLELERQKKEQEIERQKQVEIEERKKKLEKDHTFNSISVFFKSTPNAKPQEIITQSNLHFCELINTAWKKNEILSIADCLEKLNVHKDMTVDEHKILGDTLRNMRPKIIACAESHGLGLGGLELTPEEKKSLGLNGLHTARKYQIASNVKALLEKSEALLQSLATSNIEKNSSVAKKK